MDNGLKSRIISLEQIEDPSNFLIFVQGSWEIGQNDRNVAASKIISGKGIASTLLYESSRDWSALERAANNDDWINAFGDKTYQDELQELRELIDYVNKKYGPTNLFLSGSSYGGGLAALVAGDSIPNLSRVLLCSSQIEVDEQRQFSIYRGFPTKEVFLGAISRYGGELRIIHGDSDKVVPINQSIDLYNAATTPNKRLVILTADHTFSGSGREKYLQEHLEAFR